MTPYIPTDLPNETLTQVLKVSMKMTKGYKGEIFVMYLSFIGWGILTALTGGIPGIFYTGPYMSTCFAGLYVDIEPRYWTRFIGQSNEPVLYFDVRQQDSNGVVFSELA